MCHLNLGTMLENELTNKASVVISLTCGIVWNHILLVVNVCKQIVLANEINRIIMRDFLIPTPAQPEECVCTGFYTLREVLINHCKYGVLK